MPRLTDLLPDYKGAQNPEITGVTADSRAVKPGYMFAALPGAKTDGRGFIDAAIASGAVAILTGDPLSAAVPVISDRSPRRALAIAASRFYNRQPRMIAAVTGTNGKTSTAHFTRQLWQAHGFKAASLGTLGVDSGGQCPDIDRSGAMTTPDTVTLHAELAALDRAGISHLAMEASSHGLDQYRLDGVRVAAAGFTNLTLDHLDYHGDMESYRAAKLRLFSDILLPDGIAVINADSPEAAACRAACGTRTVLDYGHAARDLHVESLSPFAGGQKLRVAVHGRVVEFSLKLVGAFMAMNALCALGLAAAERPGDAEFIHGLAATLPELQGAPGRLQLVEGTESGAIYVDYAHTPDALDHVLRALRPHTEGRLIVVFGCGGDRDRTKRPLMGSIASAGADIVIVTDDNPRGEWPAVIRMAILEGAGTNATEIADRREAIRHAVRLLQPGDILVIAGKGHEQGQTIGRDTFPFDDVDEAKKAIQELRS